MVVFLLILWSISFLAAGIFANYFSFLEIPKYKKLCFVPFAHIILFSLKDTINKIRRKVNA